MADRFWEMGAPEGVYRLVRGPGLVKLDKVRFEVSESGTPYVLTLKMVDGTEVSIETFMSLSNTE